MSNPALRLMLIATGLSTKLEDGGVICEPSLTWCVLLAVPGALFGVVIFLPGMYHCPMVMGKRIEKLS